MPRTLHVIDDLSPGGAQMQLRLLASAGVSRGDAVTVAVGRYPGQASAPLVAAGIEVVWLGRRLAFDPFAARKLGATARQMDAEIVQSWDHRSAQLGRWARRWLPCPWVHTMREPLATQVRGASGLVLAHESLAVPERSRVLGVVPNAVDPSIRPASTAEKQDARERLRRRGIDLGPETPVIGAAMRMDRSTPAKELAWAADLVRVVRPGLRLLIAGSGPGRAAAERFATRACEPGTVVWLGDWPEVADLYAAADVVWCGAGDSAQPTPVLEAMAAGRPVLVAAATGRNALPGGFHDGHSGVVRVAWNDRAGWARATKRLLAEASLAAELGLTNANAVGAAHTVDRVAEAHRDVLERVCR